VFIGMVIIQYLYGFAEVKVGEVPEPLRAVAYDHDLSGAGESPSFALPRKAFSRIGRRSRFFPRMMLRMDRGQGGLFYLTLSGFIRRGRVFVDGGTFVFPGYRFAHPGLFYSALSGQDGID